MSYGFQVIEMIGCVGHAQRHGFSIDETARDLMEAYHLKAEEARDFVERHWKRDVENASETE